MATDKTALSNGAWTQTIIVILAIVATTVSTSMWIQAAHHAVELRLTRVEERLRSGGWSRPQHALWVDRLRDQAGHTVPGLGAPPAE